MTAATQARLPLPDERDDPLQAMLDLIERNIEAGLAADLAPQLEARILRLFPELMRRPAVATPSAGDPVATVRPAGGFTDIDRAILFANLAQFCDRHARAARTDRNREEAESHAGFVRSELDRLKIVGGAGR